MENINDVKAAVLTKDFDSVKQILNSDFIKHENEIVRIEINNEAIKDYLFKNEQASIDAVNELMADYEFYYSFDSMISIITPTNSDALRDTKIYGLIMSNGDKDQGLKRILDFYNAMIVRKENPELIRKLMPEVIDKFINMPMDFDLNTKEGIKNYILAPRLSLLVAQLLQNDPDYAFQNELKNNDPIKYNILEDKISYYSLLNKLPIKEIQARTGLGTTLSYFEMTDKSFEEEEMVSNVNAPGHISNMRLEAELARTYYNLKHTDSKISNFKMEPTILGMYGNSNHLLYSDSVKDYSITQLYNAYANIMNNDIYVRDARKIDFLINHADSFIANVDIMSNNYTSDAHLSNSIKDKDYSLKTIFIDGNSLFDLTNEYLENHSTEEEPLDKDIVSKAIMAKALADPNKVISLASIKATNKGFTPEVITLKRDYSEIIARSANNHNIFRKFFHALGFKYAEEKCEVEQNRAIENFERANTRESILSKVTEMYSPHLKELNESLNMKPNKIKIEVKELNNNLDIDKDLANDPHYNKLLEKVNNNTFMPESEFSDKFRNAKFDEEIEIKR